MLLEPVRYSLESALLSRMEISHGGEATPQLAIGEPGKPMEDYLEFMRDVDATMEARRIDKVYRRYGNVAVVQMNGVIDKRLSQFEMQCYGGYDLADFDSALQLAASDDRVERVVLAITSPGGSVAGVPESAARVARLTAAKEVRAFVDVQACSAAYYIASQADHIAAASSATIGSIGVYMAMVDQSRALEMEGYKVELIKAGKYKAMGAAFKPLADEERAMLQASVTDLHEQFKAAVRSGRRAATERGGHQTVSDAAMEGQWFDGRKALEHRLVDELTDANLDEYVSELIS
jgi:protease-4